MRKKSFCKTKISEASNDTERSFLEIIEEIRDGADMNFVLGINFDRFKGKVVGIAPKSGKVSALFTGSDEEVKGFLQGLRFALLYSKQYDKPEYHIS